MLHRFHERFGTAGLVVAIFALILALTGGAFAATGGLTPKQKKEVKKIAKKFAGKQGNAGPAGPQGLPGANGKDGAPGLNGKEGPEGPEGKEGSPWTAGGTLPSDETETGVWAGRLESEGSVEVPLSFTLPLGVAPEVHFVTAAEQEEDEVPTACEGGIAKSPKAKPGQLCVFGAFEQGGSFQSFFKPGITLQEFVKLAGEGKLAEALGAESVGTVLMISCSSQCIVHGTWAVTAP